MTSATPRAPRKPRSPSAVGERERITNLDTARGIATLGILVMNATAFALASAAYFNLEADGSDTAADLSIGVLAEIFVAKKMMGLFSLLFGVGIVVFAERAKANGRRPLLLSGWRNLLLLGIGLAHMAVWEGDILVLYAVCSPLLLLARRLPPWLLLAGGTTLIAGAAAWAVGVQTTIDSAGDELGKYWFETESTAADSGTYLPGVGDDVGLFFLGDAFGRALGMMLIGIGLYRLGIVQGLKDRQVYARMARWGLGIGLPLASVGVTAQLIGGFDPDVALWTAAPNTLTMVPVTLGYLGLITLWNQRTETERHRRIRAIGRMALTNYLCHTVIGITLWRVVFDRGDASRMALVVFIVAVWTLQYAWSGWWLDRFRFGPVEWLWRCATYRRRQPLRR